ncbi:NeuD/PglB/VioB family sugar acetyltransferase [Roseomonas sp. BN140053]|uniref:NeuD/PglB/VioB family sugar acetyltransferase n=1 Tax=Roseomonas sp. BN140053 TaxID=3391898 RepID=UPI0039ED7F2B
MTRTVLVGAGGHAAALIETIRAAGLLELAGCLDHSARAPVLGVPVLGGEDRLDTLRAEGIEAVVVAIGDNAARLRWLERAAALGFGRPAVAHPSAVLSPSAVLGPGSVVLPRVVLGARTRVGEGVILNTGCIVEHDAAVGRGAHIACAAVLGGGAQVGEAALVGLGAVLRPLVRVGRWAVVAAGAAVVSEVPDGAVAAGVPARVRPAGIA